MLWLVVQIDRSRMMAVIADQRQEQAEKVDQKSTKTVQSQMMHWQVQTGCCEQLGQSLMIQKQAVSPLTASRMRSGRM